MCKMKALKYVVMAVLLVCAFAMAGCGSDKFVGNWYKVDMEWLAQYAEFGLVNEQKLALVFVREVGAIDNATYRQLDSSITHARARLEIHKLCDLGFIEKKGQGRSTYYIRTSKVVSLGERLRP